MELTIVSDLKERILQRVSQTIAGRSNCPPAIADSIWKRIIKEEVQKDVNLKKP
jgi:chorismate mutase